MEEENKGEMSNTKAWAIISAVIVGVGLVLAVTMFCLGMAVGQNSARTEALESHEAKSS